MKGKSYSIIIVGCILSNCWHELLYMLLSLGMQKVLMCTPFHINLRLTMVYFTQCQRLISDLKSVLSRLNMWSVHAPKPFWPSGVLEAYRTGPIISFHDISGHRGRETRAPAIPGSRLFLYSLSCDLSLKFSWWKDSQRLKIYNKDLSYF